MMTGKITWDMEKATSKNSCLKDKKNSFCEKGLLTECKSLTHRVSAAIDSPQCTLSGFTCPTVSAHYALPTRGSPGVLAVA